MGLKIASVQASTKTTSSSDLNKLTTALNDKKDQYEHKANISPFLEQNFSRSELAVDIDSQKSEAVVWWSAELLNQVPAMPSVIAETDESTDTLFAILRQFAKDKSYLMVNLLEGI